MISFFDTIIHMKELISRHLNLKYVIPFIAHKLIVFICAFIALIFSPDNVNYALTDLVSTLGMLLFIIIFFRKEFKDNQLKFNKETIKLIIRYTVILFSLNIITSFIESILSGLLNVSLETTNQGMLMEMFYDNFICISISAILAGITEEMLYRYSIFRLFKNRKLAFVMSWLIFAFGHFSGFNLASYISMIGYLVLSFVLTYIYYKYDDMRIVCGVHMLNNVLGVIEIFIFMFL